MDHAVKNIMELLIITCYKKLLQLSNVNTRHSTFDEGRNLQLLRMYTPQLYILCKEAIIMIVGWYMKLCA